MKANSSNGSCTRQFFPSTLSASVKRRRCPTSPTVFQLLSGHSGLNSHQHHFGFSASPACLCGHKNETLAHYLFSWPLFSLLRHNLKETVMSNNISWPSSLCEFPKSSVLFNTLTLFVKKSKRLMFKRPPGPSRVS